jgi:hypothetical protein
MTPDEIRAAVRRAIDALPEGCYDQRSMEYSDAYPCPHCGLLEVDAALAALLAQIDAEGAAA